MTRQEYERKTADGTLTLADVLINKEYATPEQLEICTGYCRDLSKRLSAEQGATRLISELATLITQISADIENAADVDQWGFVSGDTDETNPETAEVVRATRERCKNIAATVADLSKEIGGRFEPLDVTLDTLNKILEGLDRFNAEASDGKACNADCLAYARGTCGYINTATISQPAEVYNLKDKRACPRYREIYPERV